MSLQICRLCLLKASITLPYNITWCQMLEELTAIKVNDSDTHTSICVKCSLNLKLAYRIQQRFLKVEDMFKNNNFTRSEIITVTTQENENADIKTVDNIYDDMIEIDETSVFDDTKNTEIVLTASVPKTREKIKKTYSCDCCEKVFQNSQQYRSHKLLGKRRECPVCKKAVTVTNYHKHVINHSFDPKVCEQCGKILDNIEKLRTHCLVHHSKTTHTCEICNKDFKMKSQLMRHKKCLHEPLKHVCEKCGLKFALSYTLNQHIRRIHEKKRAYPCEFCPKRFTTNSSRATHRRQHTNETPYKCDVCGEGFKQKVSLKTHYKSKHNIVESITVKCKVCNKGFASTHALGTHLRSHK